MILLAFIIGIIAVLLFVFSYQFRRREHIILVNSLSRCFYVIQYLLLGAFSGAVMDTLAAIFSFAVQNKKVEKLKPVKIVIVALLFTSIIACGIVLYDGILSLFSVIGVLFELSSLLMKKENNIRLFSMLGQPFWIVYNSYYFAWSSVIGNVIVIVSIIIAFIRYREKK